MLNQVQYHKVFVSGDGKAEENGKKDSKDEDEDDEEEEEEGDGDGKKKKKVSGFQGKEGKRNRRGTVLACFLSRS